VTAEASGRVTSVNASLGQTVPVGFVIATLENASERAAVLQAEGVYEAALAQAEQSGVGLNEAATNLTRAQNAAIATYQSSYNTVNGVVRNNIDEFFANPESRLPGLRIDGKGQTTFLNSERVAFQDLLLSWQLETTALTTDSDLILALESARARVNRTIVIIDTFIVLFTAEDTDRSYTDSELIAFSSNFTNLRSSLQASRAAINNDIAALENAQDSVKRAEISASGSQNSAADAQVKQALGALRSAQANLAKTILRTPISGSVNTVNVRVGDFVTNQQVVARVANNNALEIITFVGDKEIDAFTVGSTVVIEDRYEGTVTEIAPAVDPVTRKTEVRIAIETEAIQNGDTVRITKTFNTESLANQPVNIPLSAVKFEIEDGFIFVVEDGKLKTRPVKLGIVRGGSVEITAGLNSTDEFVLDARGLLPGTEVEVRTQE
jgi:RND family efflux transporter MFP subunit